MRCGSPHKCGDNGDTRIFVWHSHKDKGEEDTQGICVTFTQRRVGQLHSEKRQKAVAVQTK